MVGIVTLMGCCNRVSLPVDESSNMNHVLVINDDSWVRYIRNGNVIYNMGGSAVWQRMPVAYSGKLQKYKSLCHTCNSLYSYYSILLLCVHKYIIGVTTFQLFDELGSRETGVFELFVSHVTIPMITSSLSHVMQSVLE